MLKKILIVLIAIGVTITLIGMRIPSQWRIEESVWIAAQPKDVQVDLATPKTWAEWTAWGTERDPECLSVYSGPSTGVGAHWRWKGEDLPDGVGAGEMEVTKVDPVTGVEYSLKLGALQMNGEIRTAVENGGTRVTWITSGEKGDNPWKKATAGMMVFFRGDGSEDFAKSLANLKERVELRVGPPQKAPPEKTK